MPTSVAGTRAGGRWLALQKRSRSTFHPHLHHCGDDAHFLLQLLEHKLQQVHGTAGSSGCRDNEREERVAQSDARAAMEVW